MPKWADNVTMDLFMPDLTSIEICLAGVVVLLFSTTHGPHSGKRAAAKDIET